MGPRLFDRAPIPSSRPSRPGCRSGPFRRCRDWGWKAPSSRHLNVLHSFVTNLLDRVAQSLVQIPWIDGTILATWPLAMTGNDSHQAGHLSRATGDRIGSRRYAVKSQHS